MTNRGTGKRAGPRRACRVSEVFKVLSGRFVGWRMADEFFSEQGEHLGRFIGQKLFRNDGSQIGWVYPSDERRVGLRKSSALTNTGARGTTGMRCWKDNVPTDLPRIRDAAWTDPK